MNVLYFCLILVYLEGVEGILSALTNLVLCVVLHLVIDIMDLKFKNIIRFYVIGVWFGVVV